MGFLIARSIPEIFEVIVESIYCVQSTKITLEESYLLACEVVEKRLGLNPPYSSFEDFKNSRLQPLIKKIMKKIKFIKDHKGLYKNIGDVEEYDTAVADFLIREGFAEEVKTPKKEDKQ